MPGGNETHPLSPSSPSLDLKALTPWPPSIAIVVVIINACHPNKQPDAAPIFPIPLGVHGVLPLSVPGTHPSFFSREANVFESSTDGAFADLTRPQLRHFSLSFIPMLLNKRPKLIPVANFVTMPTLVVCFGGHLTVLLIALIPSA